jgi:hypothetical protein
MVQRQVGACAGLAERLVPVETPGIAAAMVLGDGGPGNALAASQTAGIGIVAFRLRPET